MAPTKSPTPVTDMLANIGILKSTRIAGEDKAAKLAPIACSTVMKTNPKINQITPKGMMREMFLLVLGDNTFWDMNYLTITLNRDGPKTSIPNLVRNGVYL